ncbi:hypothetical protein SRHO_G00307700 [Serrasalmus rhombeus]
MYTSTLTPTCIRDFDQRGTCLNPCNWVVLACLITVLGLSHLRIGTLATPVAHWETHRPAPVRGTGSGYARLFRDYPRDYWYLKEVFSKEKAQVLLPHREFDCTINLLPEATLPCGDIPQRHIHLQSDP